MYSIIERNVPDVRCVLHDKGLLDSSSAVLFEIGNCALVETVLPSCSYSYKAICIKDGREKAFRQRKIRLPVSAYDRMAERIMMLPFYESRELPSETSRAMGLIGHIFAEILPQHGFLHREKQSEMSLQIYNALCAGRIALCEAGTGSGKTLAYIVSSLVYGLYKRDAGSSVISTSTIALQKAITEEYIPELSKILLEHRVIEEPLTFVIRKGKGHYACDLRLQGYRSSVEHADGNEELLALLDILIAAPTAEIDLSLYPFSRYVKDCICVTGRCPSHCPKAAGCRFHRYMDNCMQTPYSYNVVNHAYLFAHIQQLRTTGVRLLPEYRLVIFDEAHKLLEAARQIYGVECLRSEIDSLGREIHLGRYTLPSHREVVKAWLDMLMERNTKLFELAGTTRLHKHSYDALRTQADISYPVLMCIEKICDGLRHLDTLISCHTDIQLQQQLPSLRVRIRQIHDRLVYFKGHESLVLWIEARGDDAALCALPKDMDAQLAADIWQSPIPNVLTSGTLSAGGDFSLLKRTTGLAHLPDYRIAESSVASPFDYRRNALLFIPEHMPFPDRKNMAYVTAVADEIWHLVNVTYGHTLVLFSSYGLQERVYNRIGYQLAKKYSAFIMKHGRVDVLDQFRSSGNGVLFASDSAGEGVDLPGDILSSLIVVKLPFLVPDAISEHEREKYASMQEYRQKVIVPDMIVRLKQYVGRAIRTENDTAVISILDSRAGIKGSYRAPVLAALPPMRVTDKKVDVEAFIREKKDDAYFGKEIDDGS